MALPVPAPAVPEPEDWSRVAQDPEFKALLAAKARFVAAAGVVFVVYYFALPALVGYATALMRRRVLGPLNLAYVFALSQFFMAWTIAALYMRAANRFDRMGKRILAQLEIRKRYREEVL